MKVKFEMGGSGIGGQGPGWIGSVCYKKAGEIVELDTDTDSVEIATLSKSKMATLLPPDYVPKPVKLAVPLAPVAPKEEPAPEQSDEEKQKQKLEEYVKKLKGMHIANLKKLLGLPGNSDKKKAEIIEELTKQAGWANSNG